jgi:adenylylsulfate kinase-like enzyme
MLEDGSVIPAIIEKRKTLSPQKALPVGISGIDASGKGFVTTRIAESLQKRRFKLAVISADGWLNLPHVRFHQQDLAKHFYENAIRFDEMFERVIHLDRLLIRNRSASGNGPGPGRFAAAGSEARIFANDTL